MDNQFHVVYCNSCSKKLKIGLTVSVSAKGYAGNETRYSTDVITQPFRCKYCKELMVLNLSIKVSGVQVVSEIPNKNLRRELTTYGSFPERKTLMDRWDELGLLDVLEATLWIRNPGVKYRLENVVFSFLKNAEPVWPPNAFVKEAAGIDDLSRIKCWSHNGITGIVIDGRLRTFVVSKALVKKETGWILFSGAGAISRPAIRLQQRAKVEDGWIKTRFGYVVGKGELFDEIRRHPYIRKSAIPGRQNTKLHTA